MTADAGGGPPPAPPPPAEPHPELKALEPLVGTWSLTGRDVGTEAELTGRLHFRWMEGGFFLIQDVDIWHPDGTSSGLEVIGYDEARRLCTSSYFDSSGNRFTYVWELRGVSLAVWLGEKGAAAGFTGTLADGGDTITGTWEWPGGGYRATMTRVTG